MGDVWVREVPSELRRHGIDCVDEPGCMTRARSSGGFDDDPLCVMWHHTASPIGTSLQSDANYAFLTAATRPICNLLLGRNGQARFGAAGATNTNGTGISMRFSRGTVPANRMNLHAFGMEICNNGVGEHYPQQQIDAAFIISNVVNELCGNRPDDVGVHWVYSPGRKIDPARAGDTVEGPWHPSAATSAGSWTLEDLRAECVWRAGSITPPTPPIGDPSTDPRILRFAMYRLGVQLPGKPGDGVAWFRITSDSIDVEPNGKADSIDSWSGVPGGNVVGAPDFVTMFNGRRAHLAGAPISYDEYLALVGPAWNDDTMRNGWK